MSDPRDHIDDPLEAELRTWFKGRSTPPAPRVLRTFAAQLESKATPTAPVRRRSFAWRQAPASRLAAATIIAVTLVAGGLFVVSGQFGPAGPTGSASVSASPGPTGASTSSPSAVDDGGTFGATGLWATRGNLLFLSTDQGVTWVQRTLAAGVSLDATSGTVLSSVFVLDATHAWTARPGPGSTVPYQGQGPGFDHLYVIVSRSVDGGVTWASVDIPGDWGGTQPVLAFADAEHGFLLLSGLRFGGRSVVFATADGGATWQRVGGADSLGSIFSASDAATLWAGNEGDAGPVARPILDVSRDGGRTWADARLPGLVGDIFVNDNPVAPPVFSGQDGAVAVIAASTDTSPMVRFYRSSDGGRTWVLAAQVHIGETGSTGVAVVDALHYVVIGSYNGRRLATSDGGVTWQQATSNGLGAALRLRFWSPGAGAAIVQQTNGPAPAAGLLRTVDGGQTWTSISVTGSTPTATAVVGTEVCVPEPMKTVYSGLDPCPPAIAAVHDVVAPLGLPIARLILQPQPFCGGLWPGVGSPAICFGVMVAPGTMMHGWVSFRGSDKVAAVSLRLRGAMDPSPAPSPLWVATIEAFQIPPAGWVMP